MHSPGPLPPRHLVVSDPVGDVETSAPGHRLEPSVDVTTLEATYRTASQTLEVRIGFADLLGVEHQQERFLQSVTVANDNGPYRAIHVERHGWHGESVALHADSTVQQCAGAGHHTDLAGDTVLLTIPVTCLSPDRRAVRLSVWTTAQQVFEEQPGQPIASDELRSQRRIRTR